MDEHGLQSPFVYRFYTNALNDNISTHAIAFIEEKRQNLIHQKTFIDKSTTGANTKVSKGKSIASIAKHGISSAKVSKILSSIAEEIGAAHILELGTSLGVNSLYLSEAKGVEKVTTIDANEDLVKIAREVIGSNKKIHVYQEDIDQFLDRSITQAVVTFDFIYIDANHTFDATLRYYEKCRALLAPKGLLIFDDINWSPQMGVAWRRIKELPEVGLTIENYQLGLVFNTHTNIPENYVLNF